MKPVQTLEMMMMGICRQISHLKQFIMRPKAVYSVHLCFTYSRLEQYFTKWWKGACFRPRLHWFNLNLFIHQLHQSKQKQTFSQKLSSLHLNGIFQQSKDPLLWPYWVSKCVRTSPFLSLWCVYRHSALILGSLYPRGAEKNEARATEWHLNGQMTRLSQACLDWGYIQAAAVDISTMESNV